jgi:predicted small lipoprotein YifL
MKKTLVITTALLTLLSAAACTTVGKAPVGKAPVVTKG